LSLIAVLLLSLFGKSNILYNHTHFIYLIKGTILGRWWGVCECGFGSKPCCMIFT